MTTDLSSLTREVYPMPDDIAAALANRGVRAAYDRRPAYQRNDYVGWICRSKRPETRQKRLEQMLAELEKGGVYMHMRWTGQ